MVCSTACRGKRDHDAHVPASQFAEQAVFVSTAARQTRAMECTRLSKNNNNARRVLSHETRTTHRTRGGSWTIALVV